MKSSLADPQPASQGKSFHRVEAEQRTAIHRVEKALCLLRQAIHDTDWDYPSLESFTGKSRSYLHAVLNGVKPCRLEFLAALPDDVRERHACLVAEQYGYVTAPAQPTESAARHFLGLLSCLRPEMLKASLPVEQLKPVEKIAV